MTNLSILSIREKSKDYLKDEYKRYLNAISSKFNSQNIEHRRVRYNTIREYILSLEILEFNEIERIQFEISEKLNIYPIN